METIIEFIAILLTLLFMVSIPVIWWTIVRKLKTRNWHFTRSQRVIAVFAGLGILLLVSPFFI